MLSKKIFLLLLTLNLVSGCGSFPSLSDVIPDNRTKYKKSQSLPDLEVPPDLTSEALNDQLVIPDEENAKTLSEFQRRRFIRQGGQVSDTEIAMLDNTGKKYLLVQGTTFSIWPKLREFWLAKGFEMDLDDAELGVMETQFKEISVEGAATNREKFKIISEESRMQGSLILFLVSEAQEKIPLDDGSSGWIDKANSKERTEGLISELDIHFYGAPKARSSASEKQITSPENPMRRAKILNAGEGKEYLTIPDEFFKAWRSIEDILNELDMQIENKDAEKGIYFVVYNVISDKQNKGLLSRLKFWESDEEAQEFHISLTGVGDKTEIIVLDKEDQWIESEEVSRILSLIQNQYNRLLR